MAEANKDGDLAVRIKKARAAATRLAEKSDVLNAAIMKAQEAIAGLRLGVGASVLMEDDDPNGTEVYLSFERLEGTWGLIVATYSTYHDEWNRVPLLKASRSRRMAAVDLLPRLVETLLEKTEQEIDDVGKSAAAAEAFAAKLREAQS